MTTHAATYEDHHMPSGAFDTLAYCKKLRAAGVPEAEAEAHAEAIAGIVDERLATKHDIWLLQKDIQNTEKQLRLEIQEMGYKLTIRLGSMLIVAVMVLAALIKIL